MVLPTLKHKHTLTSAPPGGNRVSNRFTWSQVASRNIVSCHESHQQLPQPPSDRMDEDTPVSTSKFAHRRDDLFYDVLTPYIVGLEPDSVLIDVTDITNLQDLKNFLGNLNSEDKFRLLYSQHRRTSIILGSLCSLIFDYA
jgi:hypothetical protein